MPARGARWIGAGVADQIVMASGNAANTLLPLGLLGRSRAGNVVLVIGLGYFVLSVNRSFVGDVLLAQVSRLDGRERERMVRHALATGTSFGCVSGLALLGVALFWRHPVGGVDLGDLIFVAPFLPAVLLHDTGRYTYLSERAPARALVIDLVWVGVQAGVIATMVAAGAVSSGLLLASWGLGACAGVPAFLLLRRARPWRGDPRRWLVHTRGLSGWFAAANLIGQVQVQAVAFLVVGRLSRADLAVLRSGQTALLQPVQNLVTAMLGLLVPRASRLAGGRQGARLHRQTLQAASLFAVLAAVLVAMVVPVSHLLRPHIGEYRAIVPLALPIGIQAGLYLVQVPFTAAIRGMQQGWMIFVQYAVFAACSLTGLVLGARYGLLPAVWALTAGAAVGLAVMIGLYAWALRHLPSRTATPEPADEVGAVVSDSRPAASG